MSLKRRSSPAWSLATRLAVWYAGSAFAVVLAATGLLYWALVINLEREDDEFLADKVEILRALLRDRPEDTTILRQEVEWEWEVSRRAQVYVRLLDEKGRTAMESPGMEVVLPAEAFPTPVALGRQPVPGIEVRSQSGKHFRALAARAVVGSQGGNWRVIQVALDRTREQDLLALYRKRLWTILVFALMGCAVLGRRITRRGIRPVEAIAATARRIRSSTLDERIETERLPVELSALARTFNEMFDRLEESFLRLSRFSADIAHELRTPVNNLRGELEVSLGRVRSAEEYREVQTSCLEECLRLSRMIESLLFLARSENPKAQVRRERVDVGQELKKVREFYEVSASEAGVALSVVAPEPIAADLDRGLLQRAVANLVANALAHTPPGGAVRMGAARDGGSVRVTVSDTGSGIPPAHLPHVFDRFYRVDGARSAAKGGVGLGLSIVKSIAALHGGSVQIASEPGRGTEVILLLPATQSLPTS